MGQASARQIQHMVKWLREKPEVIAWVRSKYNEESLPDWIGRLEGDVDYDEVLRQAGVVPPDSGGHGLDDDGDCGCD